VSEESLDADPVTRRLIWGVLTDFVCSQQISTRFSLKQGPPAFLLISYNPGQSPKFFQFRMMQESIEYKLNAYGNIHSADSGTGDSTIFDLSKAKKKGKVENLNDILRPPGMPVYTEDKRNSKQRPVAKSTTVAATGTDAIYRSPEGSQFFPGGLGQYSSLGKSTSMDDAKVDFSKASPELFEYMFNRQENMLSKQENMFAMIKQIYEMMKQRDPSSVSEAISSMKQSQQTVSIGTNTTMKAKDLQTFLQDEPRPKMDSLQKMFANFQDRSSLSHTYSGHQRSDGDSHSSRPLKDDAQPSPIEDVKRVGHFQAQADETNSLRSSNTANKQDRQSAGYLPAKSRGTGSHMPEYPRNLPQPKPHSPAFQSQGRRGAPEGYNHPYSPQLRPEGSSGAQFFGRATESALSGQQSRMHTQMAMPFQDEPKLGGKSISHQTGMNQHSQSSGLQNPDRYISNVKDQPIAKATQSAGLPTQNFTSSHIGVPLSKYDQIGKFSKENGVQAMQVKEVESSLTPLASFPGMEANVKESEFDNGGGRSTFEIPVIRGNYHTKHHSSSDSDNDDDHLKDIQRKYMNK